MKRLLNIVLILGFFLFSFSTTICYMGKLNTDSIVQLVSDIAEEEDETEKDTKTAEDAFFEIYEYLIVPEFDHSIKVNSESETKLLSYNPSITTPPPKY